MIVADPEVLNGVPCFRGTRVPFKNRIDFLEGGQSLGEFLRQFPDRLARTGGPGVGRSEGVTAGKDCMKVLWTNAGLCRAVLQVTS